MDRLKNFIARHATVIPVAFAALILCGFISVGAYYTLKNRSSLSAAPRTVVLDPEDQARDAASEVATDPEIGEKIEEFTKNPPKTSTGSLTTKPVKTSAGTAVVMSTGASADDSKIQSLASRTSVSNFSYVDTTGQYPSLGETLRGYLSSSLLHAGEENFLYEVDLVDCAECDYGGYWTGSYVSEEDDIVKAFGYITLNIGPYKNSAYKEDYMKLIFSHEYGHHYTMYHRWVDQDIPAGQRFADQYYSIRPLPYGSTAVDYSLGWANCDAEIIAEDYSYFFSGYGYSGIAAAHGYPSNPATRDYLKSLSGQASPGPIAADPIVPVAQPERDTVAPSVRIVYPAENTSLSGQTDINISASDDISIQRVDLVVDDNKIGSDNGSPYQFSLDTSLYADGRHKLTASAYDSSGNQSENSIFIEIANNMPPDTVNPEVSFSQPPGDTFDWNGGNLRLHALATDNVQVTKIQIYINDTLVAEENDAEIVRIWMGNDTPAGSYTLKARACDSAGNWGEKIVTIIKT